MIPGTKNLAYLYVIGADSGPCKVGYSVAPKRRLADLQRPETRQLFICGSWPVGHAQALATERYAHWLLREHQVSGEWFDVPSEIAGDAVSRALHEGVDPDYPMPRVDMLGRALGCGEVIATKYPAGTRARIRAQLTADQHQAEFIRDAIEAELKRRERKPKPTP